MNDVFPTPYFSIHELNETTAFTFKFMAFLCYIQFALKCRHRYCYRTAAEALQGNFKESCLGSAGDEAQLQPLGSQPRANGGLMHQKWRNHMGQPYVKQQFYLGGFLRYPVIPMLVVSEIWKVPCLKPTARTWKTIVGRLVSFQGLQYVSFREGTTWLVSISAGSVYPEIFHLYRNSFLGKHRLVVYEPLQPNRLNGEFLSFWCFCWTDLQTGKLGNKTAAKAQNILFQ